MAKISTTGRKPVKSVGSAVKRVANTTNVGPKSAKRPQKGAVKRNAVRRSKVAVRSPHAGK